jgi:hypothetical protein
MVNGSVTKSQKDDSCRKTNYQIEKRGVEIGSFLDHLFKSRSVYHREEGFYVMYVQQ